MISQHHQANSARSESNILNVKAVRTISLIIGAFYLSYIPFIVEHVIKALGDELEPPEWAEIAIYLLAVSNSFWNPLIYIGTNREAREAAKKTVRGWMYACGYGRRTSSIEPVWSQHATITNAESNMAQIQTIESTSGVCRVDVIALHDSLKECITSTNLNMSTQY